MVGANINTAPADGHPGSAIVFGCANVLRSVLARTKRTVRWPPQTAMASCGGPSVSIARGHWISCFRQPPMTRNHYQKPVLVGGVWFSSRRAPNFSSNDAPVPHWGAPTH